MSEPCIKCGAMFEPTPSQIEHHTHSCRLCRNKLITAAARRRRANGWRPPKKPTERLAAKAAVQNAVRTGAMSKQPCEVCGDPKSVAHHSSYAKDMWLAVTWLCPLHHKQTHALTWRLASGKGEMMDNEPQPERFGNLAPIPNGWSVRRVETDGDHFIVCDPDGEQQSCIHWNRYVVRKWAIKLAADPSREG